MRADLLTVVTSYFNPMQYASRKTLYDAFAAHMQASGVRLITVECALGERPFEVTKAGHPDHVQVRTRTVLWIKENLINLGFQRASEAAYLAWIDADITFRRSDWAAATVDQLQHYAVVQPWSDCYDLGPHGEHLQHHRSFCAQHHHRKSKGGPGLKPYEFWHPGYAWAARRSALERLGGLVDFAALGAGDHHMALALVDQVKKSIPGQTSPAYLRSLEVWQARATKHIVHNIGYVPGTIEHAFHGKKEDRRYVDRWTIITANDYDPDTDVKHNLHGVIELVGNKPALRDDIDKYFRVRNEDINSAW